MTCRVCVDESPNVMAIFEGETTKYDIPKTIHQHLQFQPHPDDPISTIICLSCWKRIEEFHGFYLSVEKAQERFANLRLETVKAPLNIEDIKEELKIEPMEAVLMNGDAPENIHEEACLKNQIDLKKESHSDTFNAFKNDDEPFSFSDSHLNEESDSDSRVYEGTAVNSKATNENSEVEIRKRKSLARKVKRKLNTDKSTPRINLDTEIVKQSSFKCDLCPDKFLKFNLLQRHCLDVHNVKGYIACCSKKFHTRYLFANHLARHVQAERPMCDICKKTYVDSQSLKRHIEFTHASEKERIHQCEKCPLRFTKKFQLKQHLKTHEPSGEDRRLSCEECGNLFKNQNSLQSHRRSVHELAYSVMCDICAKVFRSRPAFEVHMRHHADVPPPRLQCPKCQRWYKDSSLLKRHLRTHEMHDGKEHVCKFCGKRSPSYVALKSHLRYKHLGQKSNKCTLCDAAFMEKIALKEHMATHTGIVLYSCPNCSKTSNSKSNMYAHRKRMHPDEWAKAKKLREMAIPES